MSSKTNKALKDRVKITKNGKVKARKQGQTHFHGKKSGEKKQKLDRSKDFDMKQKDKDRLIPHDQ